MGGTNGSTTGRRYRRARRLRQERHGVVAVIGTLLALLVFFALFGIFLTQYLPLWMTDNESQLAAQAATSFASFKSSVDEQYALGGPQSYATPFVISSQGVPLLAQPTQGTLSFVPSTCAKGFWSTANGGGKSADQYGQPISAAYCSFVNVTETPTTPSSTTTTFSQSVPTGLLELVLPNRYYTPESYFFEDDGVVQAQSTGYQIMAFPPPLNVSVIGGNTTVHDTLLQLYGNSASATGQGSEEVYSHYGFSRLLSSSGVLVGTPGTAFTFTFEIGTLYPCAWFPYLYHVLSTSGATYVNDNTFNGTTTTPISSSTFPGSCFNTNGQTTLLSFSITNVNYASVYFAGIQVGMGVGST